MYVIEEDDEANHESKYLLQGTTYGHKSCVNLYVWERNINVNIWQLELTYLQTPTVITICVRITL